MGPAAVLDLPPSALHAPAAVLQVTPAEAHRAFERLQKANPGTKFLSAEPSQVPGLIKLRLANGQLAYADKSGRYLILGVVFDMTAGQALDGALDAKPDTIPGETND